MGKSNLPIGFYFSFPSPVFEDLDEILLTLEAPLDSRVMISGLPEYMAFAAPEV